MSQLLGPNGKPITSAQFRRDAPPKTGPFGRWGAQDSRFFVTMPGGGLMQFNLDNLTLADFRQMRDHYQVNASLSVLTFMLHQIDWHIDCDNAGQRTFYTEQILQVWNRLVRALSQSFWAGFSPNALEWENDVSGRRVVLDKVKDLSPESCRVNWKKQDVNLGGGVSTSVKVFDGIKQDGWPKPIPVENSLWYPLLMENGNYYGKQILRAAFQPYYFSILLHLFANRYYERFGEPVPVGRAPFEEEIDWNGERVMGNKAMEAILRNLRNRSTVVLPNDRTAEGNETNPEFDYQIEYLESQMRGADFERYITRLDEEISLGLFTPLLLMRTADVGSYNLGVGHTQVWLWMLNALTGDWAEYINKYILIPLRNFNFGPNAAIPRIKFRRLGKENASILQALLHELLKQNKVKLDLDELGEMAGLTLEEVREVTEPLEDPDEDDADDEETEDDDRVGRQRNRRRSGPRGVDEPRATSRDISSRVAAQVTKAFKNKSFGPQFVIDMGYRKRFEASLEAAGFANAESVASTFYNSMEKWINAVLQFSDEFLKAEDFMSLFNTRLNKEIVGLLDAE